MNEQIEILAFRDWLLTNTEATPEQRETLDQIHEELIQQVGPLIALDDTTLERRLKASASLDFVNAYLNYRNEESQTP